tara:strand:+ start:6332 stop:8194 length:1863 start_codon:yes stop_codon:yes gene_type:complete
MNFVNLIIFLSILPIVSVFSNNLLKGPKQLNWILPAMVYSSILILMIPIYSFNVLSDINGVSSFNFIEIKNFWFLPITFHLGIKTYTLISLVVLGISILILIFSSKFIENESYSRYNKYFLFLTIFITSMFLFVISNDLLGSFIFWEFLGLASYFLIGFWNKDNEAIKSSTIAFWITRVGDLFFLSGIIIISSKFGTLNYILFETTSSLSNFTFISTGIVFIIIAVLTKSAQFPFNIWLPKAMKGPTPVSALIHSATMVVAGVILLGKIDSSFLTVSPLVGNSLEILFYIGLISTFVGSIMAYSETDIKKILAYSTISHIGLMYVAVGLGQGTFAEYHLFSHSFFKSMLFLLAGVVIATLGHSDLEQLKGTVKKTSLIGIILLIGCLSLSSVYLFTGSESKEAILSIVIEEGRYIELGILIISVFFTALYSSRLYFNLTDIKFKNSTNYKLQNISWRYYIPLLFLALFSAFGPITKRIFFDSTGISLHSFNLNLLYVIPIQLIIITAIIINYFYEKNIQDMSLNLKKFAKRIFDSEPIYIEIYNKCFKGLSIYIAWFDRNIIDGLINVIPIKILSTSKFLMSMQDGIARKYAIRVVLFFVLLALFGAVFVNISNAGVLVL